jgi:glycosyltransferase involved in cell wall biosynthesis
MFQVSVIIPAYNVEKFVQKAILSALEQGQVGEVIVVNDGSIDDTQYVLNELTQQNRRLVLLNHPSCENRGRSASRNLGIKKAKFEYIAFLDADDYYLANRFYNDMRLLIYQPNIDGVYNAIGSHFYREVVDQERDQLKLYTLTKRIDPEHLFETLFNGTAGHFSIDGLTVKKSLFDRIGVFNEKLEVAEDTELIYRMTLKGMLVAGNLKEPVAVRGVHDNNVFNDEAIYKINRMISYEVLLDWCNSNGIAYKVMDEILKRIWIMRFKMECSLLSHIKYWSRRFIPNRHILFSYLAIKYFPLVRRRKEIFSIFYK